MKLTDYTESAVNQFAGPTMFSRGSDYYERGMVMGLEYNADEDRIEAQVAGNYGDYELYLESKDGGIRGHCDCPYDGWPCKHMVAALLTFVHQKKQYAQAHQQRQQTASSLATKIKALSQQELADLMVAYAQKYPDVKRNLMVLLASDQTATVETLQKEIRRAFPAIESANYSTSAIAKKLKKIVQSVKQAPKEIKAKVLWAVADQVIGELNEYGMNDSYFEDLTYDVLDLLLDVLVGYEPLKEFKATVIDGLMEYYLLGNFGIGDMVYETASGLCSDKSDYQIIIRQLKRSPSSYNQQLLANLYEQIGDTDAQRITLEKNLENHMGMDYWRLAQYWFDQNDQHKAFTVIQDGIDHGQGRKQELYGAMQQRCAQNNDYDSIMALLRQKIKRNELDQRSLRADDTYQYLWDHYSRTANYQQQKTLLELCISSNQVDLELLQLGEQVLKKGDFQNFSANIISNLLDRIAQQQREKSRWSYGVSYISREASLLAEIYNYLQDVDNLFAIARNNIELLQKYESTLLSDYGDQYLEIYKDKIDRLIEARGRGNYQTAMAYVQTLKQIYLEILNKPADWQKYITHLRTAHKSLRALQDELSRINL